MFLAIFLHTYFCETHFHTPLFFALKCHPPPMGSLFLLFMERNIIHHLNGMMRRVSFKTPRSMLHIPTWTSRWVFLCFFVWKKMLFPCFIESLMLRHCHFIVCSCWNLGHCMIDYVVILALEHFWIVVCFGHGLTWTMLVAHEFWQCW